MFRGTSKRVCLVAALTLLVSGIGSATTAAAKTLTDAGTYSTLTSTNNGESIIGSVKNVSNSNKYGDVYVQGVFPSGAKSSKSAHNNASVLAKSESVGTSMSISSSYSYYETHSRMYQTDKTTLIESHDRHVDSKY